MGEINPKLHLAHAITYTNNFSDSVFLVLVWLMDVMARICIQGKEPLQYQLFF